MGQGVSKRTTGTGDEVSGASSGCSAEFADELAQRSAKEGSTTPKTAGKCWGDANNISAHDAAARQQGEPSPPEGMPSKTTTREQKGEKEQAKGEASGVHKPKTAEETLEFLRKFDGPW